MPSADYARSETYRKSQDNRNNNLENLLCALLLDALELALNVVECCHQFLIFCSFFNHNDSSFTRYFCIAHFDYIKSKSYNQHKSTKYARLSVLSDRRGSAFSLSVLLNSLRSLPQASFAGLQLNNPRFLPKQFRLPDANRRPDASRQTEPDIRISFLHLPW